MTRGRFIVFEGGEGTGKTTQSRRLAEHLDAHWTREPGDTPIGARLRELLLAPELGELDDRAEALLMAADRAQHVAEVIRPTIDAGRDVVCDRYIGSSVAYQGHARALGAERIAELSDWATDGLHPDLVVLLEVPEEVAAARLGELDRIESAGPRFHRMVTDGYRAQAQADPERWVTVDGSAEPDEVWQRVLAAVEARLGGDR